MDTSVANNGEFVVTPRQYNRYNMVPCWCLEMMQSTEERGSNIQSDTRRVSILILQSEWYCGGQEQDTDLVITHNEIDSESCHHEVEANTKGLTHSFNSSVIKALRLMAD